MRLTHMLCQTSVLRILHGSGGEPPDYDTLFVQRRKDLEARARAQQRASESEDQFAFANFSKGADMASSATRAMRAKFTEFLQVVSDLTGAEGGTELSEQARALYESVASRKRGVKADMETSVGRVDPAKWRQMRSLAKELSEWRQSFQKQAEPQQTQAQQRAVPHAADGAQGEGTNELVAALVAKFSSLASVGYGSDIVLIPPLPEQDGRQGAARDAAGSAHPDASSAHAAAAHAPSSAAAHGPISAFATAADAVGAASASDNGVAWLLASCEDHVVRTSAQAAFAPASLAQSILRLIREGRGDDGALQAGLFDLLGAESLEMLGDLVQRQTQLRRITDADLSAAASATQQPVSAAYEPAAPARGMPGGGSSSRGGPAQSNGPPPAVASQIVVTTEAQRNQEKERRRADRRAARRRARGDGGDAEVPGGGNPAVAAETAAAAAAAGIDVDWLQAAGFDEQYLQQERALGLQKGQSFAPSGAAAAAAARGRDDYGQSSFVASTIGEMRASILGADASLTDLFTRRTLPEGTTRVKAKGYEEVMVPPRIERVSAEEEEQLVLISALDDFAQKAFRGTKRLNRLQSRLFDVAYNTNENMLVCAPTGAGKTNVAMLTIVREIGQHLQGERVERSQFKIVYVAPMKALAQEVVTKFKARLSALNVVVAELTGAHARAAAMTAAPAELACARLPVCLCVCPYVCMKACSCPRSRRRHAADAARDRGDASDRDHAREVGRDHAQEHQRRPHAAGAPAHPGRGAPACRGPRPRHRGAGGAHAADGGGVADTHPHRGPVRHAAQLPRRGAVPGREPGARPLLRRRLVPPRAPHLVLHRHHGGQCAAAAAEDERGGVPEGAGDAEARQAGARCTHAVRAAPPTLCLTPMPPRVLQVMIFVHSRKDTAKTARAILELATQDGTLSLFFDPAHPQASHFLRQVSKSRARELTELVNNGIGIHHAGMLRSDRCVAAARLCCIAGWLTRKHGMQQPVGEDV